MKIKDIKEQYSKLETTQQNKMIEGERRWLIGQKKISSLFAKT